MTGSYGRHEASEYSDLDIFFVKKGKGKPHGEALSRVDKALMDAAIIKICREIGFPELTGSGRYLDVYLLDDFRTFLGSRKEDYENILTARMLLLLESQSVHGDEVYEQAVQNTIDTYYEDYHGHEEGFLPVFLVNDIQRYWKTMCLNYEHNRRLRVNNAEDKHKTYLKNDKLKFSRIVIR